jgi:Flp pilus assembly protein TadG
MTIRDDSGNALVEVALLVPALIVPLVWLAVSIALAVSGQSAATLAAREAARAYVRAADVATATRAARSVAVAVTRAGAARLGSPAVHIKCSSTNCLAPNSRIDVTVNTTVALGFLPKPFGAAPTWSVTGKASALVDPYREQP